MVCASFVFAPSVHPGSVDKRTLQEQTPLLLAVSCEHLPCVRCLLESGADPDICSNNKETPLYKGATVKSQVFRNDNMHVRREGDEELTLSVLSVQRVN